MIKKIAVLLSAFCIASAAQAEMKIVVLDTVRAILETEEAKVLIEAAGREMEPEQTEVQGLAEQRQGLIDKVRKDGEVMSNSEQAQIQKDIEAIEIDLQFLSQKLQKTVQDKRQEILVALAPKFEKVRKVAEITHDFGLTESASPWCLCASLVSLRLSGVSGRGGPWGQGARANRRCSARSALFARSSARLS